MDDLIFDEAPKGTEVRRAKEPTRKANGSTAPADLDIDPESLASVRVVESLILDPADPLPTAREFVGRSHTSNGVMALHHHGGVFYEYDAEQGAYGDRDEAEIRAELYAFLEPTRRLTEPTRGQSPKLVAYQPTRPKVDYVLDALRAVCNLPASCVPPCFLQDAPDLDPFDIIAFPNGLLYIPRREVLPATPNFFTLTGLDFAYDAHAPAPTHWLKFLPDLWPNDDESIAALQEWMGYLLTPDTRFQKIAMLVGPKRSGKGTIGRVVKQLLGARNVCGPTLSNLGEQFGLSILVGKSAAIIADARISGRTDTAVITEQLLSISGEDTRSVPRKFLPDWTGKLSTRFMLLTNELPKIEDSSGALASRFMVWTLQRSFLGCEDHELFDRFVPELPGILNWALEGRDRLYARGRFVQPRSAANVIQQFEDLGSPIGAFLRDRCDVGEGHEVMHQQLFDAWKSWCQEAGRDRPGTIQTFGRNLRAALPWLGETFPRVLGKRIRYYEGVRLRAAGEGEP